MNKKDAKGKRQNLKQLEEQIVFKWIWLNSDSSYLNISQSEIILAINSSLIMKTNLGHNKNHFFTWIQLKFLKGRKVTQNYFFFTCIYF
jgi:hypothetical protein